MGTVFKIQRYCIHDGPGVRTTVFLKGCPLDCLWCHNPESKRREPEVMLSLSRCVSCGRCVEICPAQCHAVENGRHRFDAAHCIRCGACVEGCGVHALEMVGQELSADEVIAQVLRDRIFYGDDGGMTVSGGEPLTQCDFLVELLWMAHDHGIHTAVETCGMASEDHLLRAAEHTDLFLYDWKETDPEKHRRFTGADNHVIRRNLHLLRQLNKPVILRCPIIPGYNDRPDHLDGIARLTHEHGNILSVEIEPYHSMGEAKRTGLGCSMGPDIRLPSPEEISHWKRQLTASCRCPVSIPSTD